MNNRYFTCRYIYIYDNLPLNSISDESCRENQHIRFMLDNFFYENCTLCKIMWGSMVELDRPQRQIKRGPCTLRAG